ncbi:MAG: HD-GYP domain-containing protein [Porticoccaceae bacterium]|nr:HD-GYP domain-containing protein [Porticoccaceae bacterium]
MLKKIKTSSLVPGMHIHAFCGPWLLHPFWRSKFTLKGQKEIKKIQQSSIKEVIINIQKGCDVAPLKKTQQTTKAQLKASIESSQPPMPMEQELSRAITIYAQSKQAMQCIFDDVRMGKTMDVNTAKSVVDDISKSVMSNSEALISIVRLKNVDEYTYMHSVAVCALMMAMAKALGWQKEQIKEAGLAGLLHDVGKANIPTGLLNKPGSLTEEENKLMRSHPEEGYKILKHQYSVSAAILDVCLHHHEKVDGSGYPSGLIGNQISQLTKIASICDVYDAITSDRAYKEGWNPADALKKMSQWTGHLDQVLFQTFVKLIGIYPIGALVKLKSEKLGVVYEQNSQSLLKPRVKVFFCVKTHRYLTPEIYDLSDKSIADSILGPEDPENWGISNTEQYWAVKQ